MADYPSSSTVPQAIGTTRESSYGTIVDRAVNGKPRFRTYYGQQWHVFKVVHDWVNTTQKDAVLNHYASDRLNEFHFTYAADATTYHVMYAEAPQVQALEGNAYYRVTVTLVTTQ